MLHVFVQWMVKKYFFSPIYFENKDFNIFKGNPILAFLRSLLEY